MTDHEADTRQNWKGTGGADVTMRYIECDPRILRQMFEDVI